MKIWVTKVTFQFSFLLLKNYYIYGSLLQLIGSSSLTMFYVTIKFCVVYLISKSCAVVLLVLRASIKNWFHVWKKKIKFVKKTEMSGGGARETTGEIFKRLSIKNVKFERIWNWRLDNLCKAFLDFSWLSWSLNQK